MNPVTIAEIRAAIRERDYVGLHRLYEQIKTHGIERCDQELAATVGLSILECSLFGDADQTNLRTLGVMLDAIERGNHPYEDPIAGVYFEADAAISKAELDA